MRGRLRIGAMTIFPFSTPMSTGSFALAPDLGKQGLRNDDTVRVSHFANGGLHGDILIVVTLLQR